MGSQENAQEQQHSGQTGAGVGKHTKTNAYGNTVNSDNGGTSEGKHENNVSAPKAGRRINRQTVSRPVHHRSAYYCTIYTIFITELVIV